MKAFFAPSSIAVVGGSADAGKPGGRIVHNLKAHGFATLWVVNAKSDAVQGLPTFATVEALPAAPDLAVLCIPAPHVLDAARRLLARGTRALIVLSAGFSETDERGRALEAELVGMVERAGAALIGPNSLGVLTPEHFGVFGGPDFEPAAGSIDLVSASGSTAAFIMEAGLERGLRFASMVSVGNCAQLGVEEVLAWQDEHFAERPAKVKLLYLEAIEDPARLLAHGRSLSRKGCRLVALKSGVTEVGARAASSHTGAMASSDAAVSALFDKAGIVRIGSKTEMTDVAALLGNLRPPRNRKICIVTQAGGPGILLADELSRQGFEVPELPEPLQARLRAVMSPGSSARNPVDFLASGSPEQLRAILRILGEQQEIDLGAVPVVFGSPGLGDVWPAFQEILRGIRELPIPVYPVLPSVRTAAREAALFRDAGFYSFVDEVGLGKALGAIARTPEPAAEPDPLPLDRPAIEAVLAQADRDGLRQLGAVQVETILRAAGFQLPRQAIARTADQAADHARAIGLPAVLKVVGPIHKSELNGVRLGLRTEVEVREAFGALMEIAGAEGVLVQAQESGLELIVGASREGSFGHLILFGLGGIFTEALKDVTMGLAPLSRAEASRLVGGIRCAPVLDGLRGRPGVERRAVEDALLRLSGLVAAFPQIAEVDLNPLIGRGASLVAVDARMRLAP